MQVRAKAHFEKLKTKSREADIIVITEIPYQLNKARLIERSPSWSMKNRSKGIAKLRDESDRSGMRIVVELKTRLNP
jgi:DNA gyrase subunit A